MELICALLFRAALSPAADKGTGTPQPPAHAGERTLRLLTVVLTVLSWALRAPHASTQSMPGGTPCRAGPRASAREFPMVHNRALMRNGGLWLMQALTVSRSCPWEYSM